MNASIPDRECRVSLVLSLVLGALMASCGGDGDASSSPLATGGTGTILLTTVDSDGKTLADVHIVAIGVPGLDMVGSGDSDQHGSLTLGAMPSQVVLTGTHPLGVFLADSFNVAQSGITSVFAVVDPEAYLQGSLYAAALVPVSIPAGSVSADRSELDVHVTVAASEFVPANSGEYGRRSSPTPALGMQDCVAWLDAKRVTPACVQAGDGKVTVLDYAYDPVGAPVLPASQGAYSALLLLDLGSRVSTYDPYDFRALAAKYFIRSAREGVPARQVAVAGLAGQGRDVFSSPLLPQLPLSVVPSAAMMFSVEHIAQEDGVDSLVIQAGGASPVIPALQEAFSLMTLHAPTTGPRAIVALLGGGDNSGLSELQRREAIASLQQAQADSGIQVVLVASRMYEESRDRSELAELAAALHAPVIYSGFPREWKDHRDGLHFALGLASKMLSVSPLPTVSATFRVKSSEAGGFQHGVTLHGTVWIESGYCPNDCKELPLHFAVEVP